MQGGKPLQKGTGRGSERDERERKGKEKGERMKGKRGGRGREKVCSRNFQLF